MTDYAIDDSEYQRLQRENERLKAERDLAVRLFVQLLGGVGVTDDMPDSDYLHFHRPHRVGVQVGELRKVLAWYREAQNAEKGGE